LLRDLPWHLGQGRALDLKAVLTPPLRNEPGSTDTLRFSCSVQGFCIALAELTITKQ
jgi:hypothetical protein